MSLGLNINGLAVPSKTSLFEAVQNLRPRWLVVMDDLTLAKELSWHFRDTKIAFRRKYIDLDNDKVSDESVTEKMSPEMWLEKRQADTDGKIYLYTTNEPGFNQHNINWLTKLMVLCEPRRIPLVIGNWSCGVPANVRDWSMAKNMLFLLDQHRDLFVLGLHEYAAGIITSGFIGGAPNDIQHHADFTIESNWPVKDTADITMWHCGRYKFLLNYCKEHGIAAPRIVMTEHGFDYMGDLRDWLNTIIVPAPHPSVRGWRTLENYWREKLPHYSHPMAYAKQLLYADQYVYANSPVEGQCLYTWSLSPDWTDFDISGSQVVDFVAAERRATGTSPVVIPIPIPPVVIPPAPPPPIVIPPPPPPAPPPVKHRMILEWESNPRTDLIVSSALNLISALMGEELTFKPVTN